jgi:pectate lyase
MTHYTCTLLKYATGLLFIHYFMAAQQLAFPTAEGFGRFTTGGRGGAVYEVTNLSDAGAGSLRYGIESVPGARTIVFKLSGTIELTKNLQINNGNLTIAGQTAPADGICIKNSKLVIPAAAVTKKTEIPSFSTSVNADNVIIRYIRFRPGDELNNAVGAPLDSITFENDALTGRNHKNIMIDHCSMSWAIDEVSSFYDNSNFTMQWCLMSESLYHSFHSKGNHGYGGIWGGMGASFHHNLLADHTSRNPRFCGARYHLTSIFSEVVDYRNNVIFNWAGNSAYGGEGGQQNMVNNYYKPGPGTKKKGGVQLYRIVNPSVSLDPKVDSVSKWYLLGNFMEGYPAVTSDNLKGGGFQPQYNDSVAGLWARIATPFAYAPIATQTAQDAYESVLAYCGASLIRDSVDMRIINQVRTGTTATGGTLGVETGIIDNVVQAGGWPMLKSTTPPIDTDHDGMPDDWEIAQGLNPNNEADRNTIRADGYTQLEAYIDGLAGEIATGVAENDSQLLPKDFKLYQNYPNPFNPTTTIKYDVPRNGKISMKVYDVYGREIAALVDGTKSAGLHQTVFNGHSLSAGVYFVRLSAEKFSETIKLILVK